MTPVAGPAYLAAVLMLYVDLPDTPLRASASDQWLARKLYEQGVPLSLVESALLLGSLRRLFRPADLPPLTPIRSLAYFQPVITELQQNPLPDGYLDYLRLKLRNAAKGSPADVQKNTFSDDR
ncbi:MAG TPA: hypothetical protein VJ731_18855 [Terriglobales bacterium]|jgi:hypothetical protein|nr:hypothetical protein [Terriglobales bacterium]